jgi:hypothetical protein
MYFILFYFILTKHYMYVHTYIRRDIYVKYIHLAGTSKLTKLSKMIK